MASVNKPRNDIAALVAEVKALKSRVRTLETSRRIGNTAIDEGDLHVRDGAARLDYPGSDLTDQSAATIGRFNHGPTPVYGVLIQQPNGTDTLAAASSADGSVVVTDLYDRSGNLTFSTDQASGVGLAKPYLGVPFGPPLYRDNGMYTNATTTDKTVGEAYFYRKHPRMTVWVNWWTQTGCTGRITVVDAATGDVYATANTTAGVGTAEMNFAVPYDNYWRVHLAVKARLLTTATDPFIVAVVVGAEGVQS